MAIIIGKLPEVLFTSRDGTFTVYKARASGGKRFTAIYRGEDAPKPRKTVQVVLFGEWVNHKDYGKQFEISRVERYNPMTQYDIGEVTVCREASKAIGEVTMARDIPSHESWHGNTNKSIDSDDNPNVCYQMTLKAAICVATIKPKLQDIQLLMSTGRITDARRELEQFLSHEGIDELDHGVMRLDEQSPLPKQTA